MTWTRGCRPLRYPDEIAELQALVTVCHPGRTPRPDIFFFAHPTIVATDGEGIVGYSCLTMAPALDGVVAHPAVYGLDTGVHPRARGAGLGRTLLLLRFAIGRLTGAEFCVGTVAVENQAMAAIHREVGMERSGPVLKGVLTDVDPPGDAYLMIAPPAALDAAVKEMFP